MAIKWFYDNQNAPDPNHAELVHVERVYIFEWDEFTYGSWERLDRLYQHLPQWLGYGEDNRPYWFGTDEDKPPYLWASVKASGLVIHGAVFQNDWRGWDIRFRELTRALPKHPLT